MRIAPTQIVRMQIVEQRLHAGESREPPPLRASFIASMVTAFGISGANGRPSRVLSTGPSLL